MPKLEIHIHAKDSPISLDVTSSAGNRVIGQFTKKLLGESALETFRITLEDGGLALLSLDLDHVVGILLVESNTPVITQPRAVVSGSDGVLD
ncbi:MAG: hypothetical protein ACKVH0_18680 [Alphaproteobacteria bacterium]